MYLFSIQGRATAMDKVSTMMMSFGDAISSEITNLAQRGTTTINS